MNTTIMKNEGICRFCMKSFSGSAMGRHLVSCKAKKQEDSKYTTMKKLKTAYTTSKFPLIRHIGSTLK